MAKTAATGRELQDDFLKTVRKSQEFVLGAITTWSEAVQAFAPEFPVVHLPLAGKLPQPKKVVDSTYDFAEKLLANQRKFAEDLIKALAPLAPAVENGHPAKAGATTK